MKKTVLFALILLSVSLNVVSAGYMCADNSSLIHDSREISVGEKKNVNGLAVGVSYAEERTATNRINAIVIADAQLVNLTNTSSFSGEFTDKTTYSISLVNISNEGTGLKVGSSTKVFDVGETYNVDGKEIALLKSNGISPGNISAEVMIGKAGSYLSTDSTLYSKFAIDAKNYLVSLTGLSGKDATIKVSKCSNASLGIIEEGNPDRVNLTENSDETSNNTDDEIENATAVEDDRLNESANVSDANLEIEENINSNQKANNFIKIGTYIGSGLSIIVILFIIFKYMQERKRRKENPG
ncbi:hypothetical protein HYT23_04025 [Candidatus Pacearchaeota archaeon]|nr:hypothetical protein [Candidatus Pacearchaeota archaeon]